MNTTFVHIGCGLHAPDAWANYDASPTLVIQRIPLLGMVAKSIIHPRFPDNVRYGDIVNGIKGIANETVGAVYCSHVLEHLSLADLKSALRNIHLMLKAGGTFRMVLPDLHVATNDYMESFARGNSAASIEFMRETILGVEVRTKGITAILKNAFGNAKHLWMWDRLSLSAQLKEAGFSTVRSCTFGDSEIREFQMVEEEGRFLRSFALEAKK